MVKVSDLPVPAEQSQPRRTRRTGPYKAADGRRQAILEAAVEHFATWGFFNASVPKIAADVGLTKAGLLHHFGSKEQLLAAVLETRDQQAIDTFFTEGATPDVPTYLGQVAALSRFNENQPGLTQLFSVLSVEASNPAHPAHLYFRQRYARVVGASADVFARAAAAGDLRPGFDPDHLASELIAVLDGLAVQWALSESAFSLSERVAEYLNRLSGSILVDRSCAHRDPPLSPRR